MINPSWLELAWTQHPFSGFTETKRGACRYGGYVVHVQRESRAPTFANLALVQVDIPFVCLPQGEVSSLLLFGMGPPEPPGPPPA